MISDTPGPSLGSVHSPEWHVLKAEELLLGAPPMPGQSPNACHSRAALVHAHLAVAEAVRKYNL